MEVELSEQLMKRELNTPKKSDESSKITPSPRNSFCKIYKIDKIRKISQNGDQIPNENFPNAKAKDKGKQHEEVKGEFKSGNNSILEMKELIKHNEKKILNEIDEKSKIFEKSNAEKNQESLSGISDSKFSIPNINEINKNNIKNNYKNMQMEELVYLMKVYIKRIYKKRIKSFMKK